jgi:2-dehydropantoate 2-reductase
LTDFVALDPNFRQIADVQAERWTKQIFNGAWNPMTALTGLDTHQLLASPHLYMVHQLANETYQVAIHMGVPLPDDLPEWTIELARVNPTIAPSMLQDVRRKKAMEVDSLCGE